MSNCGGCSGNVQEPEAREAHATIAQGTVIAKLTKTAAAKVKEFMELDNKKNAGLRIQVTPGGCAGYQYGLDFDEKPNTDDFTFEQHGVTVFVDPESAQLLVGTEVDFVESLHGSGFKINNPNAKSSCGCGNSFS